MNSEELEQSLRTEFESYLKNNLADIRQEVSQFQQKLDTELEKHKSHLDEVFRDFSARIETDKVLDAGFQASVVEHLRLARDEGATITAAAIGEAEEIAKAERAQREETKPAAPSVELSKIRDAIYDISSQNSQSAILKALIDHAAGFTPRGAFFVVKNEHFVGWRVFGKQANLDDASISEAVFPVSSTTILGDSVNSLSVIESAYGNYAEDSEYLVRLDFGKPAKMFAIPLIARGRGVAAIYADCGEDGGEVDIEALETIVSVAGLTVELLASAQPSQFSRGLTRTVVQAPAVENAEEVSETEPETAVEQITEEAESRDFYSAAKEKTEEIPVSYSEPVETASFDQVSNEFEESTVSPAAEKAAEVKAVEDELPANDDDLIEAVQTQPEAAEEISAEQSDSGIEEIAASENLADDAVSEMAEEHLDGFAAETDVEYNDAVYESGASSESVAVPAEPEFETNQDFNSTPVHFEKPAETSPVEEPSEADVSDARPDSLESFEDSGGAVHVEPAAVETVKVEAAAEAPAKVETIAEEPVAAPAPARTRFSERNVDLPIDVSEEERRLHNDARRFARLLISEIKLYNEQKVKEGREACDLYERLREAIDRSREMYDKRVQPTVVERFDYFHHEVVNNLADGEESKLGASYPGAVA